MASVLLGAAESRYVRIDTEVVGAQPVRGIGADAVHAVHLGDNAVPPAQHLVGALVLTRRGVDVPRWAPTRMELLLMLVTVLIILLIICALLFILRH